MQTKIAAKTHDEIIKNFERFSIIVLLFIWCNLEKYTLDSVKIIDNKYEYLINTKYITYVAKNHIN